MRRLAGPRGVVRRVGSGRLRRPGRRRPGGARCSRRSPRARLGCRGRARRWRAPRACRPVGHARSAPASRSSVKHARATRLSARRRAGATRRGDSRGSGRRPPVPVGSGSRLPVAVASIVASSPTATPAPAWLRVSGRTCSTFAATARLISRGTAVASSVIGRSGGGSPAGRSFDPRRYAAWWRSASSSAVHGRATRR